MNLDQIIRLGAYQADAIKQAGTLAPFVTTTELVSWANEANYRLEKELRAVNENYFAKQTTSATASAKILGIDYAGSSFAFSSGTLVYTLPPDFLRLVSIHITTSGYSGSRFERRSYQDPAFQEALRTGAKLMSGPAFYYDIIGERTLAVVPDPGATLALSLTYISRWRKLTRYSTGTVASPAAATAVTGTSTAWSTGTLFDAAYLDIMFGTSASATLPVPDPSWDYEGDNLARVASITSDTAIVLASNKVSTIAAGTGYILSAVPRIPAEHHNAIANFVWAKILAKAGSQVWKDAMGFYDQHITVIREDVTKRGITDQETPVPFRTTLTSQQPLVRTP